MRFPLLLNLALLMSSAALADTAFVNVNVVTMQDDRVLSGQTVVVSNGRISAIGKVDEVPVSDAAEIVDGTDRFLIPGLAEMHAHVPAAGSRELQRVMTLFVANGVTTIRGMLGRHSHLALRQSLADGEVFGPRLITSGPSLNGSSVSGPSEARRMVTEQHAAGYDFLKLHPGLDAEEFQAIAETANELEMDFAGHVPVAVGVQGALDAGMTTIDHLDGYLASLVPADSDSSGGYGGFFDVLLADDAVDGRINDIAMATAVAGTWNVPTQSLFEHRVSDVSTAAMRGRPEMRYMPKSTVNQWVERKDRQLNERGFNAELAARAIELRRQIILALHEAGAGLLLGSDAPQVFNVPGFSIHYELEFLVESGLTPYEALATGTTAVAEFFDSNTGRIEAGRDADLILLDDNPLDDISSVRRIHGVMLRGAWHSRVDLDQRISAFRRAEN